MTHRITIVICTMDIEILRPLLPSLSKAIANDNRFEIVLVNQSEETLAAPEEFSIPFAIHVPNARLSAPQARNFGSQFATGSFLWFLDDDCVLFAFPTKSIDQLFELLKSSQCLLLNRGEAINGVFESHWTEQVNHLNFKNFPTYFIEWNFVIDKALFLEVGRFDERLGPGAPKAQAGEAFLLAAKIIGAGKSLGLVPEIKISHPSLFNIPKAKAGKYHFASGYAIGKSLKYFSVKQKLYWIFRCIFSFLKHAQNGFPKIRGLIYALSTSN